MAEISGTLSEGALARSSSHGKWYTLIPPIKKKRRFKGRDREKSFGTNHFNENQKHICFSKGKVMGESIFGPFFSINKKRGVSFK